MGEEGPFYTAHSKIIHAHFVKGWAPSQITKPSMNLWKNGAVFGILFSQSGVNRKLAMTIQGWIFVVSWTVSMICLTILYVFDLL